MTDGNKGLLFTALLAGSALAILWGFSGRAGITRRVSREMEWSANQDSLPLHSRESQLARLPEGAVRLKFVAAPNSYVVAEFPGLLPYLQRLEKKEISVEFEVACALWGGPPAGFTITSIAGLDVEHIAGKTGWTEGLGRDVDPLSGACDWW